MHSLVYKLTLAFLLVGLVVVGLVAVLIATNTTREFHTFADAQLRRELVTRWVQYYQLHGSWEGAEQDLHWVMPYSPEATSTTTASEPPVRPDDRGAAPYPLIVNAEGVAVFDAAGYRAGETVPPSVIRSGEPLEVDGVVVGTLVFDSRAWPDIVPRTRFLDRFWKVFYWGVAGAIALALILGALVSRSLTRSLRELTTAAEAMSKGELLHSIPVRSNDEVGELTRAFNQMSANLSRSQNLRRQMTADVAHELRTPLSLVLGHAEALRDGVIPATQENFAIIYDESLRLARLVDDLRTLSLTDAGELSLDRQPVSPNELLAQATAAFAELTRSRHITLSVEAPELPDVRVDAYRMQQVLANLLSNAVRLTPAGGSIVLSAQAEPGFVRFAVRDSGPGIAPEDLPNIFERFYRSDKSRKRPSGVNDAGDSTGLGLSIARSIVEMHGGQMNVQSTLGQGASFSFTVPLAPASI